MSNNESVAVMKRIAAMIYCRSISSEFRRPVDCLYPTIIPSYLTLVKTPMDLGTILYHCIEEKLTSSQLRENLQLVFNNAIIFNAGVPLMESISAHIDSFAGGLFEEAINMPYRDIPEMNDLKVSKMFSTGSSSNMYITDFQLIRLSRRRFRLFCVKDMTLDASEVSMLHDALIHVAQHHASNESMLQSLIHRLSTYKNISKGSPIPSLQAFLLPMIRVSCSKEPPLSVPDMKQPGILNLLCSSHTTSSYDEDDPLHLISDYHIYPQNQSFIRDLDDAIGELLVCMHERMLRGCRFSSIWACPHSVVWAQPTSAKQTSGSKDRKTTWWAGMVVGGGKGTEVPISKNDCNTTRIPSAFANQLLRTKTPVSKVFKGVHTETQHHTMSDEPILTTSDVHTPKLPPMYSKYIPPPHQLQAKHDKINFASGNSSLSYGADNKYLVEFFGVHDFGWTKGDAIVPFTINAPGPRGCSQDAVAEAIKAEKWFIRRQVESYHDVSQHGMHGDDMDPDEGYFMNSGVEGNEDEDIELPLMKELEASIRYPPRPQVAYVGPTPVKEYRRRTSTSQMDHDQSPAEDMMNQDQQAFPIHPLYPVFEPLSEHDNASKTNRAIARTRTASSWMNAMKPISLDSTSATSNATAHTKPPRQSKAQKNHVAASSASPTPILPQASPFDTSAREKSSSLSVEIDSLLSLPSIAVKRKSTSSGTVAVDDPISQTSERSSSPPVIHDGHIPALSDDIKPATTKRIKHENTDNNAAGGGNKKHNVGSSNLVCNISTTSARVYAGDGIVHSKVVDLSSSLFYYEDKRCEIRKEILRQELEAIEAALKKLNNASIEREKQKERLLQNRAISTASSTSSFSAVAMGYKVIGK